MTARRAKAIYLTSLRTYCVHPLYICSLSSILPFSPPGLGTAESHWIAFPRPTHFTTHTLLLFVSPILWPSTLGPHLTLPYLLPGTKKFLRAPRWLAACVCSLICFGCFGASPTPSPSFSVLRPSSFGVDNGNMEMGRKELGAGKANQSSHNIHSVSKTLSHLFDFFFLFFFWFFLL